MAKVKFKTTDKTKLSNNKMSIKEAKFVKKSKYTIKALIASICFNIGFILFMYFNN